MKELSYKDTCENFLQIKSQNNKCLKQNFLCFLTSNLYSFYFPLIPSFGFYTMCRGQFLVPQINTYILKNLFLDNFQIAWNLYLDILGSPLSICKALEIEYSKVCGYWWIDMGIQWPDLNLLVILLPSDSGMSHISRCFNFLPYKYEVNNNTYAAW